MAKKTEKKSSVRHAPRFQVDQEVQHVFTHGPVTIIGDVSSGQGGLLYEVQDGQGCKFVAADCELSPLPDPKERRHYHAEHDRHLSSSF